MIQQRLLISFHVKFRFIERIRPGIGFTDATRQISRLVNSPRMLVAQPWLGSCRYKIVSNGVVFCIQNWCVTTCYPSVRR